MIRDIPNRLLAVPLSTDPQEARRRRLLSILLTGMTAIALIALFTTPVLAWKNLFSTTEITLIVIAGVTMVVGNVALFALNRRHGQAASIIFLLLLIVILSFSDEPREVVDGRSLFVFSIPILMASVLLRPYASFVIAGLCGLAIIVISLTTQDSLPNVPAIFGFFAIALVSWLSARSLEQALADLRAINRELDQRVERRTRDLTAALARELAEAGKNQAILEGIADGVIVFDREGKAMVANPAMSRLIDRPPQAITGSTMEALMGESVAAEDREVVVELLGKSEAHLPSIRFDWGKKNLSVSIASVRGANDQVIGTVVVFRDFTREAEVERLKSSFVSMVSHDLRTPLGAIIGYVDMLLERVYGPLTDKQQNVMQRINANTGRLLSLVNNLLDQAQIEAGRLSLHFITFDAQDLIRDLESVMSILAQSKGLEFFCHIDPDLPAQLTGDKQRLHQILVNLVGNAIKFTDRGRVDVRLRRADADHWAMEVTDTGPGISPKDQETIFDPFGRAGELVTREHVGIGLGLAIVTQLTVMMGGKVELDSEIGRGSTFTVMLPLEPTEEVKN